MVSEDETRFIIWQILSGLAAVHDEGIVHRDLNLENILIVDIDDDESRPGPYIKICDFGFAAHIENDKIALS